MTRLRRTITPVVEQEDTKGSKARMVAFGYKAIGKLTGWNEKTVRRAQLAKEFDINSLASVIAWIANHRKTPPP